jgi:hypothetical protein
MKHYNSRDVYEALMSGSTGKSLADLKSEPVPDERGGINPKVVGPSEEQATLLASTYLAFNNHNGYVVSFKDGHIPPLVVTLGGVRDAVSNERAYPVMPVQPMLNGIVAALAREGDFRDEDCIEGPTPDSSANGMDTLRRADFGGEETAVEQVIKRIQQYEQRYGPLEIKGGKSKIPAPGEGSPLSPGAIAGNVAGSIAATGGVAPGAAYYSRNRGRNTGDGGV